jgi:hypothetical protein
MIDISGSGFDLGQIAACTQGEKYANLPGVVI